jgi:Tfp pilus assembly protein PilO
MSNVSKIILIIVFFIINVLLVVLLIIPNLTSSVQASALIGQEEEYYRSNMERLSDLGLLRDKYNVLSAEYEKYSMQIPSENDLSFFTNEIYEIAKYAGVVINSVDIVERESKDEKEKQQKIDVDILLEGSYYDIINFIGTIEKMPRITVVEELVILSYEDEYEELNAHIIIKLYYIND